ncbi:MAG: hypothetical protein JW845_00685 [Dehalococcoidales bacterium]|nr:hypothetical protein [Dehalococcoidales bacterium]
MFKKVIFGALLLVIVVFAFGCPSAKTTTTTPQANVHTISETTISPNWAMRQIEITLEGETKIVLTLEDGDKVDGFFYLTSGENISFSISGTSLIYESIATGTSEKSVSSDRFSFTASQSQGLAYTLKLKPESQDAASATVVIQLIYPASGEILIPIGTK